MDSIVRLFGSARRRQITLTGLRQAIEETIASHPQALSQALLWLDDAQTREPIPVTDFVVLRQDIADHLRIVIAQRDVDTTRVGRAGESTLLEREQTVVQDRPHMTSDATIVAGAAPIGMSDATVVAGAAPIGMSDATIVAGAAPIGMSDATIVAGAAPIGMSDATVVAGAAPVGMGDATHATVSARPSAPSKPTTGDSTVAAPSLDPDAPNAIDIRRKWLSVGAIAVMVTLAVLLWPRATPPKPEPPAPPTAQTITPPEPAAKTPDVLPEPPPTTTDMNDLPADTPVASLRLEVETPARPPLPETLPELVTLFERRLSAGTLSPNDHPDSAGFVLAEMIRRDQDSREVSDARAALSAAHLALARSARERGDLDTAQAHLDQAFDVKLMGMD